MSGILSPASSTTGPHCFVYVEAFDGLDLEMESRELRADNVRAVGRARELLAASGVVTLGNQFVAPGALVCPKYPKRFRSTFSPARVNAIPQNRTVQKLHFHYHRK